MLLFAFEKRNPPNLYSPTSLALRYLTIPWLELYQT